MAKKKKDTAAEGDESGEGDGEAEKPKSKKKLIIMVAVFVLIGGMVAKTVLLKPKPLTAAQVAAAAELADLKLDNTCASHNGLPTKPLPEEAGKKDTGKDKGTSATTTTTLAPDAEPAGPVDSLDAITINLAAGHYLKVGLALQVPAGVVPKDVADTENWEALALKTAIDTLSGQTLDTLSAHRQEEEHTIGDSVCRKTEGKVLTVYFTDFVMQ
jgi:flagellar basal body-associated protein FliL